MGVTGCGKSTVGAALAAGLGVPFIDGDSLHSAANVARMSRGVPLDDEDRWPWFDRIIARFHAEPAGAVIACSALKRAYRDYLRAGVPGLRFLYLDAGVDEIMRRVADREGHFMPAALVESQFAALERPEDEAGVVSFAASAPVEEIVRFYLDAHYLDAHYLNAHGL